MRGDPAARAPRAYSDPADPIHIQETMAAAATCVSSAAGLLAMLDDDSDELKRFALAKLNPLVPSYWYQISGSIASVEALSEDEDFQARELAALIASKVRDKDEKETV